MTKIHILGPDSSTRLGFSTGTELRNNIAGVDLSLTSSPRNLQMELYRRQIRRDVVERQLAKILSSRKFVRAERSCRLLRYLVENTIGASGHPLKEYVVGVEVLGKNADFDTRFNSVVRVEASRLRQKLRAYYQSEGSQDPLLISLPRGGYQMELDYRHDLSEGAQIDSGSSPLRDRIPSLEIRVPRSSDVPHDGMECLLDTIWRSLHLAAGLEVFPPPSVQAKKNARRSSRTRDHATFSLDLTVQLGESRNWTVTGIVKDPLGDRALYETESSDIDLIRCGYRIAHSVLEHLKISPAASRWYELGCHLLYQLTPTDLWNSRACFELAALANGSDLAAHAALALACALLYIFDAGDPEALAERIRQSAAEANTAEQDANAYLALAVIAWGYDGDRYEAERLLNIAGKIDPGTRLFRYWRALFLASMGEPEDAADQLILAHDPQGFSVASELALGCASWLRGEYSKAAARFRWVAAAEPKNNLAHLLLGWALLADSRPQQAVESFEVAQALSGPGSPATAALGFAAARAGRPELARDILEGLGRGADAGRQFDAAAGIIHLGLGEVGEATMCLRVAQTRRSGRVKILNFTPELRTTLATAPTAPISDASRVS